MSHDFFDMFFYHFARKVSYAGVTTHDFVLDERGLKMSSLIFLSLFLTYTPTTHTLQKKHIALHLVSPFLWLFIKDFVASRLWELIRIKLLFWSLPVASFSFFIFCLQDENSVPCNHVPIIDRHALFQLENVVDNIKDS